MGLYILQGDLSAASGISVLLRVFLAGMGAEALRGQGGDTLTAMLGWKLRKRLEPEGHDLIPSFTILQCKLSHVPRLSLSFGSSSVKLSS